MPFTEFIPVQVCPSVIQAQKSTVAGLEEESPLPKRTENDVKPTIKSLINKGNGDNHAEFCEQDRYPVSLQQMCIGC